MRLLSAFLRGAVLLALAGCESGAAQSQNVRGTDVPRAEVPALTGPIMDQAGILAPATEAHLADVSGELERRTTDQLVVVTVPDLHGRDVAEMGLAYSRAWGIGQRGKDNGVLILVAPNEHRVRIEVGCGLEAILPDERAAQIINEQMIPAYRQSNFDQGTERGAEAIAAALTAAVAQPRIPGCHV